jgi:hypothetical protein
MKRLICIAALLLMTGCIPSLHAVYRAKDLVFDPQLVGAWGKPDGRDSWKFTESGAKSYRMTYTDREGTASSFKAHLSKLDDMTLLDLEPEKEEIRGNDFYKAYLLPLHTFFRVEKLDAKNLELTTIDHDWLKRYLKDNPGAIEHSVVEGTVLLTAPTEELQAFLLKQGQTDGAFTKPLRMTRR